jgi:hypothetical protein
MASAAACRLQMAAELMFLAKTNKVLRAMDAVKNLEAEF